MGHNELVLSRSSFFVSLPVLIGSPMLGALAAFFGLRPLAAALILLFLLSGVSRLWAFASADGLSVTVSDPVRGIFPGGEAVIDLEIHNGKLLPVVWLELFFPLSRRLCLVPEDSRKPEEWETADLSELNASPELVGEKRVSPLLWYETLKISTRWTAARRGVYSMEGWRLRTGDGFGLAQLQRPLVRDGARQLVVYPRRIDVSPDLFLRNLWNADTGARGVMEDPTVIRSTRDYQAGDPVKHINWRLAARGLPLSVNVYEDILPKGVHFLFDGESFSGPGQHLAELEDALSILGSELIRLEGKVGCGLSLPRGENCEPVNLFAPADTSQLLYALAAYLPAPDKWDDDHEHILPQPPVFDMSPILRAARRVGRFYYIAYDAASLSGRTLLSRLDPAITTVLTYLPSEPFGACETLCLQHLKGGPAHG